MLTMQRNRMELNLFGVQLPPALESFLADTNPWWENKPMPPLPPFPRWLFDHALQRLQSGLAPVTVLRGPRQVGKTTLQQHIIDHLLHQQGINPKRIFRVQFDEIPSLKGLEDPILSLSRWFEAAYWVALSMSGRARGRLFFCSSTRCRTSPTGRRK